MPSIRNVICFFVLVSSFGLSAQTADTSAITIWLEKGQELVKQGKYHEADSVLSFFLEETKIKKGKRSKEVAEFLRLLGLNARKQKKWAEAESFLRQALELSLEVSPGDNTKPGIIYNDLGDLYENKGEYNKAMSALESALKYWRLSLDENDLRLANVNESIGDAQLNMGQFRASFLYYREALAIRRKSPQSKPGQETRSLTGIGNAWWYLGAYDSALYYFEKELAIEIASGQEKTSNHASSYANIGNVYYGKGNYERALEFYRQALSIRKEVLPENDFRIAQNYNAMGAVIYLGKGAPEEAIRYFREAMQIWRTQIPEEHPAIARAYINLGAVYMEEKDLDRALDYFQLALRIQQKVFPENHPRLGENSINIANVYTLKKENEQALHYFKLSLEIFKANLPDDHPTVASAYLNIAAVYKDLGNYVQALSWVNGALVRFRATLPEKNALTGRCYETIGQIYQEQKLYDSALIYYQKSLTAYLPEYDQQGIFDHPATGLKALDNARYLTCLTHRATTFYDMAGKDEKYLHAADTTCQLAMELIDRMRTGFNNESDKLGIQEEARNVYQTAVSVSLSLLNLKGNKSYLSDAFAITEKARSMILNEVLSTSRAREFAGLPPELLRLEKDLRVDLTWLEASIAEKEKGETVEDSTLLYQFRSLHFSKKRSYDSLVFVFENEYQKYYQLKYGNSVMTDTEVRQRLEPDQALISYFAGDSVLNVFVITREHTYHFSQPTGPAFEQDIQLLRQNLLAPDPENPFSFISTSGNLYQKLIAPAASQLTGKNLIIIPDGILSYIPFEVLLTEQPANDHPDYGQFSYLIREFQISYGYSATLQFQTGQGRRKTGPYGDQYIAFAPEFNSRQDAVGTSLALVPSDPKQTDAIPVPTETGEMVVRGGLAILNGTEREIGLLSKYLKGKSFADSIATENQFKTLASEYGILHLATHAIIDDAEPMNSRLLFSVGKDSTEDGDLHVWELYNLTLNAQMAVLSACNTGFGKLQRGEGVMSLGRAFAYAGVPGIVMSLWPAEDESTADMMGYFYEGLANGMAKDEALRMAKLKFLETAPPNALHPFYWAGFVVQGDAGPLEKKSRVWLWVLLTGFFITGGILFVRWIKINNRKS